jgi:endoglucanase
MRLRAADAIVARSVANGYRISLTAGDYVWGSNGVAANYGLQLLVADATRPDRRYLEAARANLYYLLGRNTFSLSWLSGVGANPFRHPHHRPSGADANAEPWPGLLSGGPNRRKQDPALQKLPDGLPPARMYLDEQDSFASNENAINWNAALVFLLAGAGR